MKRHLRFHPSLDEDLKTAYQWYEGQSLGTGQSLLQKFDASVLAISGNPLMFQKVYGDFRRCLLDRFPYALYYLSHDDSTRVLGLFHGMRDPLTIQTAIGKRKDEI